MEKKVKPNLNSKAGKQLGSLKQKRLVARQETETLTNPLLDIPITGDLEADFVAEHTAMKKALREADKRIEEQADLLNQTECWFCVLFETQEQKDIFMNEMGWMPAIIGDKYVDGLILARKHGIVLPVVEWPPENRTVKKTFIGLVDKSLD